MGATDELLQNAESYAANFDQSDLSHIPAKKVAVVTCMDTRISPYAILGLREGDAHVIRNAGGVVTDDEIRSLAISQHLLATEEIILIQHTECGMLTFSDEQFAQRMEAEAGVQPEWSARSFRDLEDNVREDVRRIQDSPFIPRKNVRGFVYDVKSGQLREVA
jgi:carbonic anhydrase